MRRGQQRRLSGGFTLLELLWVLAILGILAAMVLPAFAAAKARGRRIACVSNLRQTGLAFHIFANDHNGRFPMMVPADDGGSASFVRPEDAMRGDFTSAYRHFQALSNALGTPLVLACPADTRTPTNFFPALQNENVSYFVNVGAQIGRSSSLLAGDRNLTNDWTENGPKLNLEANRLFRWTREMHRYRGNILFADAHVEELNRGDLELSAQAVQGATLDLPVLPGAEGGGRDSSPASGEGGGGAPQGGEGGGGSGGGTGKADATHAAGAGPGHGTGVLFPPKIERVRGIPTGNTIHPNRPVVLSETPVAGMVKPLAETNAGDRSRLRPPVVPPIEVAAGEAGKAPGMAVFDVQLVGFLQEVMKWTYLLLLLLLLAYVAYRYWRWRKNRGKRKFQVFSFKEGGRR